MGCFSWYASDTHRAIRSHRQFPVFALRPDGDPLLEKHYEGYGEFGGEDIYELVADWNRKYLSEHPEFIIPQHETLRDEETGKYYKAPPRRVDSYDWYPVYADLSKSRVDVEQKTRDTSGDKHWEYRYIGIDIACYDDQNVKLPYPIKLVEHLVPYPAAAASKSDPGQGFGKMDRFEGDDPWGWE